MAKHIKELLQNTVRSNGAGVAIRHKENGSWQTISYIELEQRARVVGELLHRLKLKPGARVGIDMENCMIWPEIYFGIVCSGYTAVPLDPKLGENEANHIMRHSHCQAVFASDTTYPVLRELCDRLPDLRFLILAGKLNGDGKRGKVGFLNYDEQTRRAGAEMKPGECRFDAAEIDGGDPASIIYTSGTTGVQKGAMLSHRNFCSNVENCIEAISVDSNENFMLVLPLHHVFAFTTNLMLPVGVGAEISLVENLRTVGENIREVSPTVLIAVPLLLEKVYKKIWRGLREKRLAYTLFKAGLKGPVVKGILKSLGGKLRLVISGGAPAGEPLIRGFMELGIPILEGYGLTETAPVLTLNPPDAPHPGTVGKPLPNVDVRILQANEQGIGEIAARGDNIMIGYLDNDAATDEIMEDGFLLTGDLGFMDADGYVTITGRKKSLIVNREGKNIYPEEVEACINRSELVLESLVLGINTPGETGEKVGLIVVPDQDALAEKIRRGKKQMDYAEIEELMRKVAKEQASDLAPYKRPRRIQVRMEEFEKTSTRKIKRYLYEIEVMDV